MTIRSRQLGMSKNIWILLLFSIFFGAIFWGLASRDIETAVPPYVKLITLQSTKVEINGKIIEAEVAKTPKTRAKGLAGRPGLLPNHGMLFVFAEKDRYDFTMQGMLFAIDIIWIRDDTIVDLTSRASVPTKDEIPTYKPVSAVNYVLEVPDQYVGQNNIKVGDKVTINLSKIQ